jgi:arginyl-tRNA synthetase
MSNELQRRNEELNREVLAAAAAKRNIAAQAVAPRLREYVLPSIEVAIRERVERFGLDPELVAIGPPTSKPREDLGRIDLAFNVTRAAAALGRPPSTTAPDLAQELPELKFVAAAAAAGPFVNVRLEEREFVNAVLAEVATAGPGYGRHRRGTREFVVLDYSHPNIAKNMTVAHLRSTIIGHSLYKLHEAAGGISFSVNHLGDWGTQFGKLLFEFARVQRADPDALAADLEMDPTGTLMRLYRDFVSREHADPVALEKARDLFLALEHGDPKLVALWARFREWSMRDFAAVYERLRVDFDVFQGESFYEDRMAAAVDEALARGVLRRRADGAVVLPSQPLYDPMAGKWLTAAMLDQDGEPRDEIVVKPSGGSVYLTRDLAAIKYRTQTLRATQLLYVIGKEQRTHCLMLFAMAEQLGYIERGQALHTSFGHLNVNGRKMRSRAGEVVLLRDLMDEAVAAAAAFAESHGTAADMTATERAEVARKVGIGSLIFNDLRQDRQGDIEFDPDIAGRLEAGQGPYVQYAYCRLRGIRAKLDDPSGMSVDYAHAQIGSADFELVRHIAAFPRTIADAAERHAPHRIATYVNQLAQLSNAFYASRSIQDASGADRSYLLSVVRAAESVFEHAAALLHIELPERM